MKPFDYEAWKAGQKAYRYKDGVEVAHVFDRSNMCNSLYPLVVVFDNGTTNFYTLNGKPPNVKDTCFDLHMKPKAEVYRYAIMKSPKGGVSMSPVFTVEEDRLLEVYIRCLVKEGHTLIEKRSFEVED